MTKEESIFVEVRECLDEADILLNKYYSIDLERSLAHVVLAKFIYSLRNKK